MPRDRTLARQAEQRVAAEAQAAAIYKEARAWWFRAVLLVPVIVAVALLVSSAFAVLLGIGLVALLAQGLRIAVRGTRLLETTSDPGPR